jgi:hypothetical protein
VWVGRTDHTAGLWRVSGADERMIVFGGSTREGASDALWELDCSGGAPAEWCWSRRLQEEMALASGPWPPPRTSHAAAIIGEGAAAALLIVGGQDGSRGPSAAAVVADAWLLAPLGSAAHASWARLEWRGTYPLQRCRHSLAVVGGDEDEDGAGGGGGGGGGGGEGGAGGEGGEGGELALVFGGYDGARTHATHDTASSASPSPNLNPTPKPQPQTQTRS